MTAPAPQPRVQSQTLPEDALLRRYVQPGNYTDCLTIDLPQTIPLERFVEAFLTSRAFRAERMLLALALRMPSTDAEAAALASGQADRFAAWTVEMREDSQLMLCDFQRRTRSWFMVAPLASATRLRFGTAITRVDATGAGRAASGTLFRMLLPFHKLYARVLLRSAARRLRG